MPQGVYTQSILYIDAMTNLAAVFKILVLTYAVTACDTCGFDAGHSASADASPGSHLQEAVGGLCSCHDRL